MASTKIFSKNPIELHFVESQLARKYKTENKFSRILNLSLEADSSITNYYSFPTLPEDSLSSILPWFETLTSVNLFPHIILSSLNFHRNVSI